MSHLILASQSPRRKMLLLQLGLEFDVIPPDESVEDACRENESPKDYVQRLARQKAQNVAEKVESGKIIACDTIVTCKNSILGKPDDEEDARKMLQLLRGNTHEVLSGLCIWTQSARNEFQEPLIAVEQTELVMAPISDEEIEAYLQTGNWQGKAGAFGYQDRNHWISIVKGSESNVVGLPIERLMEMLKLEPADGTDLKHNPFFDTTT